jgi:uncharacterized membrane protein YccC
VLTIVIILRPSFSMTKQRRSDRIVGTVIGCVITALIIRYMDYPPLILAILVLSTVATPTFIYVRYRYTAIAVSIMILLQMHLLAPANHELVVERLVDTFVGALVATGFSFVLANWEYQSLPRLVLGVLEANLRYMEASFDLLQGKGRNDMAYRAERKYLMDSLGALSAALMRMLDEPARVQRAVEDINLFIVQNYLLVAHVAALRLILRRHARELPKEAVNAMLVQSHEQVCAVLDAALAKQRAAGAASSAGADARASGGPSASDGAYDGPGVGAAADTSWSGWPLVQRRIRLLQADASKIIVHSEAIVRNTV